MLDCRWQTIVENANKVVGTLSITVFTLVLGKRNNVCRLEVFYILLLFNKLSVFEDRDKGYKCIDGASSNINMFAKHGHCRRCI